MPIRRKHKMSLLLAAICVPAAVLVVVLSNALGLT
jgi:hypothetical protein